MNPLVAKLVVFWKSLDPKLKAAVGGFVVSYAVAKLGLQLDDDTATLVSGLVGSALGYKVENTGSELREQPRTYTLADSGGLGDEVHQYLESSGDAPAPTGQPVATGTGEYEPIT
jgi:hypothetical protein